MYSILLTCVQLRFSEQKYFTILIVLFELSSLGDMLYSSAARH